MTDFLDDAFWDELTGSLDEPPQLEDATPAPSNLMAYIEVLKQRFPLSTVTVRQPDRELAATKPKAAATAIAALGSFTIEVDGNGSAQWCQTIGTVPVKVLDPRRQPTLSLMSRTCKSPQDFQNWLQLASSKILFLKGKALKDALHPDNFCPQFKVALQLAHDIHMLGAVDLGAGLIFQTREGDAPQPKWAETPRLHSHVVKVFAKGNSTGTIVLLWDAGKWVYGAEISTIPFLGQHGAPGGNRLKFKHMAASHLTQDMVEEAKQAAWNLYYQKVMEWLLGLAVTQPQLRGA